MRDNDTLMQTKNNLDSKHVFCIHMQYQRHDLICNLQAVTLQKNNL